MDFWDRLLWTLEREWTTLNYELTRWWALADRNEKFMVVAAGCAVLMILAVSRKRKSKTVDFEARRSRHINIAQFYGALAVIGMFTFGIHLAVTNFGQ